MPSARSLRFLRTHTFISHGLLGSGFSSLPYKQNPCVQPDAYFRSSLATKRSVSKPCQSDGHPGGCHMQDPCEISIGDRTIVGPNVKFYGITPSIDPSVRNGGQGPVRGGAIQIGEDCFIGGDVVILPYRKIGKGATIGAGSVVTTNVKENSGSW
ncbi:hypothetical protein KC356_g9175 [Hortaea werneckii]|nr:hypothetical protein KC356_g9175 [Hortaea werneckii]